MHDIDPEYRDEFDSSHPDAAVMVHTLGQYARGDFGGITPGRTEVLARIARRGIGTRAAEVAVLGAMVDAAVSLSDD